MPLHHMNSNYHVGFSLFEKEDFFTDDMHERTSTYVGVLIFVEGFLDNFGWEE